MGVGNELIKDLKRYCELKYDNKYFQDMYMSDYSGCVHSKYEDGDIMSAIIDKFDTYLSPVVERIEREHGINAVIVIQPSYTSDTDIVIYERNMGKILYTNSIKAWSLRDMTIGDITDDMLSVYSIITSSLSPSIKKKGA